MSVLQVIGVGTSTGVAVASFVIDATEPPGINELDSLAGSSFVALVITFVAVIVLWRAWERERDGRRADQLVFAKDERERWETVGKLVDADRERTLLRRDELIARGRT